MERMEIKLKECCLECDHFDLDYAKLSIYPTCGCAERKIACTHMPVCTTYNRKPESDYDDNVIKLKKVALMLLNAYEYHTEAMRSNYIKSGSFTCDKDSVIAGRMDNAKEYREIIENVKP